MSFSPIYRVANQLIPIKATITLSITFGDSKHTMTTMVHFLVVDQPSAYNIILRRPLIKKINMVTTVYCLTVKFPTQIRIGYMRSNQKTASQCHLPSIKLAIKQTPCTQIQQNDTTHLAVNVITPT